MLANASSRSRTFLYLIPSSLKVQKADRKDRFGATPLQRMRSNEQAFQPARETRALPNRLAHARPKLRIEFSLSALRQKIAIRVCSQHREHRGPRAGNERGADFWLLEQPHLQLRQKHKLLENGPLQIIHEGLASKFLSTVH